MDMSVWNEALPGSTHHRTPAFDFASHIQMREMDLLLGRTLVLVAHPDDEAIGCGALLGRLTSSVVAFATDGAPRDAAFWREYESRETYARTRQEEALRVAAFVGVEEIRFLSDDDHSLIDQELVYNLSAALDGLRRIVSQIRPDTLLTLAYEGGHPDHDCCNFMASIVARESQLPAWEMPLYHRSADGEIRRQRFLAERGGEFICNLSPAEQTKKQAMLALYRSQREVLKEFSCTQERFRMLQAYDYGRPPHIGILNYEAWDWDISGREVAAAFCACAEQAANESRVR